MMQAGVKFVVFSTLEDFPQDVKSALPGLDDGYTVPHFEAKAKVYVRAQTQFQLVFQMRESSRWCCYPCMPFAHVAAHLFAAYIIPQRLHIDLYG